MTPRFCLIAVGLVVLLAGCGDTSYKTAAVSGRVTLDNKPLPNATLMFVPDSAPGDKESPPSSIGTTDQDGRYTLVLQSGPKTSGAVVGHHKVIINMGMAVASDETKPTFHRNLPEKYNRKSTLVCDVPTGGRTDADFPLSTK
jgi:hypothetical protein